MLTNDETYIVNLCDRVLNSKANRQHRFEFLRGCPGKTGRCAKLPVDAYYEGLPLVIEYWERQHTEPIPFMDQRQTCCGCNRGEQRKFYDRRKRTVLRKHRIPLVVLDYRMFECTGQGRLRRNALQDEAVIRAVLGQAVGQINWQERPSSSGI